MHCLYKNSYFMLNVGTAGPFDVRLHHATKNVWSVRSFLSLSACCKDEPRAFSACLLCTYWVGPWQQKALGWSVAAKSTWLVRGSKKH